MIAATERAIDLGRLTFPQSVALVGASTNPHSISGKPLSMLQSYGFSGPLYPVNPSHTEVGGLPAYRSLSDLPEIPDVALLLVNSSRVLSLAELAVDLGIPFLVVFSSGFNETQAGTALAKDMQKVVSGSATRLLGPNTEGLFDLKGSGALGFSPVLSPTARRTEFSLGPNVVLSQSGGLGFGIADQLMAHGLGLRAVVTTGNELDLEVSDFIQYYSREPDVRSITLVVEGFRDKVRFLAAAQEAARSGVQLVVARLGASPAGQRAAKSHTGKLTDDSSVITAMLSKVGAVAVDTIEGIVDSVAALSSSVVKPGSRVAVVSASGGSGVWMSDRLTAHGLSVPVLSNGLQKKLAKLVPTFGSVGNPVDATAEVAFGGALAPIVDEVLKSDELDAIVVVGNYGYNHQLATDEALKTTLARRSKPVVVFSYTYPNDGCKALFAELGIPWFPDPERTARGLATLLRHEPLEVAPVTPGPVPVDNAAAALACLQSAGLRFNDVVVVGARTALASVVQQLGPPLVMKMVADDPIHKTDVGGVKTGIREARDAEDQYDVILANARQHGIELRGVSLERQLAGHEVMVGAVNKLGLGPVILVCAGGTEVEHELDRQYGLGPLTSREAHRMISQLRRSELWLEGTRSLPAADLEALSRFVATFSQAVAAWDANTWSSVECNPVLLTGKEAIAVDFRFIVNGGAQQQ